MKRDESSRGEPSFIEPTSGMDDPTLMGSLGGIDGPSLMEPFGRVGGGTSSQTVFSNVLLFFCFYVEKHF